MTGKETTSLDTNIQNVEIPKEENRKKCPPFGVRSYLHQFYGTVSTNKEGTIFEDPSEEYAYLLKPKKNNRKYCRPILWKAAIWIGINFLIFGVVGILVAYFVPKKVVPLIDDKNILNEEAKVFNNNLEIVKLVGLLFFCIGGGLTIIGLLIPTLLWKHCFDTQRSAEPFHSESNEEKTNATKIAVSNFPEIISTKIDKVQPDRNGTESVTADGELKSVN